MFFDTELTLRVKLLPLLILIMFSISCENNNSVSLRQINIQGETIQIPKETFCFKYTFKCLTLNGNPIAGPDE